MVGYDGITLVVHPKNDFVKSLTVEQLKAIWAPGSKASTWKDVDPAWPDRKIILYSPDNDSGTFEFFTQAIVGKDKEQRDDVQQSADDNTLVIGVAGDRDGLGYFGYAYFAANKDKLRAVAVQNGAGPAGAPRARRRSSTRRTRRCRARFLYTSRTRHPAGPKLASSSSTTSITSISSPSPAGTHRPRRRTGRPTRKRLRN